MSRLRLSEPQVARLESAFHAGAVEASDAMARWLGAPSLIVLESLEQRDLDEAYALLGDGAATICVCGMGIHGALSGHLVFAFADDCGLSLTDLLLNLPPGTSTDWGDVERSAAMESANILGSAYLNGLARHLSQDVPTIDQLLPSPPLFRRDFAECLLQSLFVDQALQSDTLFLARARFEIRKQPLNWTLLFVPNATSLARLREVLPHG